MSEQVKLGKVAMTLGGDYNSSQSYDKLTCVQYDGCSWVSKKRVPEGVAPTSANTAYWQKISDRGLQGATGAPGQSYVDKELVPIVNDLTTGGSANVLSAEQGKVLDRKLAELSEEINNVESKKIIVLTIWSNSAVVLNGLPVGEYGWNAYNNKLVIGRGGSYSTLVAKDDTIFNYKGSLFYYENGAIKLCKNQNICISSIGASSSILEGDYVYDSGTIKLKADSYYIPIDGIDSFWYKGNRYNIADIDIELQSTALDSNSFALFFIQGYRNTITGEFAYSDKFCCTRLIPLSYAGNMTLKYNGNDDLIFQFILFDANFNVIRYATIKESFSVTIDDKYICVFVSRKDNAALDAESLQGRIQLSGINLFLDDIHQSIHTINQTINGINESVDVINDEVERLTDVINDEEIVGEQVVVYESDTIMTLYKVEGKKEPVDFFIDTTDVGIEDMNVELRYDDIDGQSTYTRFNKIGDFLYFFRIPVQTKFIWVYCRDANAVNLSIKYQIRCGAYRNKNYWYGKKWTVLGDSLTEKNIRALYNYHDYIAAETKIEVVNLGASGTGYKRYEGSGDAFYQRIEDVPLDTDVITIFGSGNDNEYWDDNLGTAEDTGTDTLGGCINTTLDNIYSRIPLANVGIVSPTPWHGWTPQVANNPMGKYSELLGAICKRRGIPFLDLYHNSGLRPSDATFRELAYSRDEGGGVHPDEVGHKLIAPRFKAFLETLIL